MGRREERGRHRGQDHQRHRLAALRAVFKWGKQRGWLTSNPAEGARIEGRGKKSTREKWFLENERAAILNAALAVQGSKRENPKTTAAKRWVPWLCAYSGARVAEMIQLRKTCEERRRVGSSVSIPKLGTSRPITIETSLFMSISSRLASLSSCNNQNRVTCSVISVRMVQRQDRLTVSTAASAT